MFKANEIALTEQCPSCTPDGHHSELILSHKLIIKSETQTRLLKSEVESRTQGSRPRPRTQKKSEAKDSLSEDRTSRGQGQECSRPRPRTEDTGASVFLKNKRSSKIFFQAISNSLAYPKFLIKEGLNHKSHDMTSSKFFQRGNFCGTKTS